MIISLALIAFSLFPDRPFTSADAETSELSISSTVSGLEELSRDVQARADAECFNSGWLVMSCFVQDRAQVYQMTEDGHPAHPAVFFRGYEAALSGRLELAERGWFAGDSVAAAAFFERSQDSMVQPEKN